MVLAYLLAPMLVAVAYGVALEFVHGFNGYKDDVHSGKTLRSLRFGVPYAVFRRAGPVPVPVSSEDVEVTELGGRHVLCEPSVPFSEGHTFVSAVLSRDRRRLTAWVAVRTLFQLAAVGALVGALVLMVVEGVVETGGVPWLEGALAVFFAWGLYVLGSDLVRLPRKYASFAGFYEREHTGRRRSPGPAGAVRRRPARHPSRAN